MTFFGEPVKQLEGAMVHFRCKGCGDEHPAPVPFAEKLYFDAAATLDLTFECPRTGARQRYNKTDLVWHESEAHQVLQR